jgi:hypothetical protein
VTPGNYQAVCVGTQGPEFVRTFRRWSLRIEFRLFAEDTCVSAFYNFGEDPKAPQIGRRSRFYEAWSQVNGEPPRKGQQMAPEDFVEDSLMYLVRVDDCKHDVKEQAKPDALVYSRVTEILKVWRR